MNLTSKNFLGREKWKPIKGFKYYEVSDLGRVRSLDKKVRAPNGFRVVKGKILETNNGSVYPYVNLYKNLKKYTVRVHRLVLENFIGPPPKNNECDHINRDKKDNRLKNLRWVSYSENLLNKHTKGYYFHRQSNGWIAYAKSKRGTQKYLGYFKTKKGAMDARLRWEKAQITVLQ